MATSQASGTQSATVGTEHILATITAAGTYVLALDLSALAVGDTVEVRAKNKVGSGGTKREQLLNTFTGPQGQPIVQSIPVPSPHEVEFTLTQTDGTARSFPWEVVAL